MALVIKKGGMSWLPKGPFGRAVLPDSLVK
jgi:hypothetical protein